MFKNETLCKIIIFVVIVGIILLCAKCQAPYNSDNAPELHQKDQEWAEKEYWRDLENQKNQKQEGDTYNYYIYN